MLVRGLAHIPSEMRGAVVAIGNFDGVHLGHQAILGRVNALAKGQARAVICFEPQPAELLNPQQAPARLTRLREKYVALRAQSIDYVLCVRFTPQVAQWGANEFIQRVLQAGVQTRTVVVGEDFHFGRGREGDISVLHQAGFTVEVVPSVHDGQQRVSSTAIRQALQHNQFAAAQRLLGRPYAIWGRVTHGAGLGRQLGYPTANVQLKRKRVPLQGVYGVHVLGVGADAVPGIANLGVRPTVDGRQLLLEVHLLNFSGDLYGRHVGIEFVNFIRAEKKFDGLEQLQAQIAKDVRQAREQFGLTEGEA